MYGPGARPRSVAAGSSRRWARRPVRRALHARPRRDATRPSLVANPERAKRCSAGTPRHSSLEEIRADPTPFAGSATPPTVGGGRETPEQKL